MEGERFLAVHGNKYQPMRGAEHHALRDIQTSPDGKDWSRIIAHRSDIKLADRGLFERVSFNAFGTVLPMEYDRMLSPDSIRGLHLPETLDEEKATLERAKVRMKEALSTNGVGHSFIHTLLPDLSTVDKTTLIRAGLRQFERDSGGTRALSFWPAETALDTQTLEILAQEGIKKVIGAPWQVNLPDGTRGDNQPVRIELAGGRDIVVVPFSRDLQEAISWGDRSDAPRFADKHVVPAFNERAANDNSHRFNFIATDMETFGGHDGTEGLDEFLQVLFDDLPRNGITPININNLDVSDAKTGTLAERSAWSCKHGDLARWHGECDCHGSSHEAHRRIQWKGPYYHAHHTLNGDVSREIKNAGIPEESLTEELADRFADYLKNPGDITTSPEKSALSAKASALAATTSCATFFDEPGTSGYINPLFAVQAITHLRDAGLVAAAERIEDNYMKNMEAVRNPDNPHYTGRNMVEDLLERRVGVQYDVYQTAA